MAFGLVFDMDGVLADTEKLSVQATTAMFKELYGVEPAPEDFTPFVGKGAVRYVEGAAEKLGVTIDTGKAVQRRTELFTELLKSGQDIAFPGAHDLISAAASDPDCKLCIATSSPREKANATLQAANIPLKHFAGYINGSMVEHKKPHPEICETAARSIGLLPGQCVAVEDAPAGVEAARAAGMKCVAVLHTFPDRAFKRADLKVPAIKDLTLQAVRKLLYL